MRGIIVGLGGISGAMLSELAKLGWWETDAVVDVRPEALEQAGRDPKLAAADQFTSLEAALSASNAEVVMINTPSQLHYEQAKAALEAGRHVLAAKPITNDFAQAVELVQLAADRKVTLSVGQQMRYNRHYRAVRAFVESGALGSVEAFFFQNSKPRPNPANLARMAQPSLYENACHHFDTFLALSQSRMPEWISCEGFIPSWSPYVGPCMNNALIRFGEDLHVLYHGGFSARAPMYEFRLEGSNGALRCHGIHMSNDRMDYEFAPALGNFDSVVIDAEIPPVNPWGPFFGDWRAYVEGGPEPSFSGNNNLPVFALLSAAISSIETGQAVEVAGNPRFVAAFS